MPSTPFRFVVPSGGMRMDRLVADASGAGRRTVKDWFRKGLVRAGGHVVRASELASGGTEVTVERETGEAEAPAFAPRLVPIVFEDERRLVVGKPAGLHSERGRSAASVASFLERKFGDRSAIGDRPEEAGLVHRLDRDTSGVLLAANDAAEYRRLRRAFREGRSRKQYLAIVAGRVEEPAEIEIPLARRGSRMAAATVHDRALPARTVVEPLESGEDWSLVLATIRSGAMHQVRVHLALEGFPLVGDELYGGPRLEGCPREGQLLHALRIQVDGELDVTAAPPGDFVAALARLRSGRT